MYPTDNTDEMFYSAGGALLVDQGNESVLDTGDFPADEYVWLGGRPVAMIRSNSSQVSPWTGRNESETSPTAGACDRNDEDATCGLYFPISDYLGKPVLMLDASRRIVGTGEYEPFGNANRVVVAAQTTHPEHPTSPTIVADFTQASPAPGLTTQMRVLFHHVDAWDGDATCSTPLESTEVLSSADATLQTLSDKQAAHLWSDWLSPSDGRLKVRFNGNDHTAYNATLQMCKTPNSREDDGVTVEAYEYRRYDTASNGPFWTPLRFPGHYLDAETGFFENWHRYYDPNVGRYLEPEPILSDPEYILFSAIEGRGAPTYVYALNNPMAFVDPDGFEIIPKGKRAPDEPNTARVGFDGKRIAACPAVGGSNNGAACFTKYEPQKPKDCQSFDGGKTWKYDIELEYEITVSCFIYDYMTVKSGWKDGLPPPVGEGLTVSEHENRHVGDLQKGVSKEVLNDPQRGGCQTEGFKTKDECEAARKIIKLRLMLHKRAVELGTKNRDIPRP